jgi:hypothetical protein
VCRALRRLRHYWIVDVDSRTVKAYQLDNGRWVLAGSYGDDATGAIPPFEAIEPDVGRLFLPKPDAPGCTTSLAARRDAWWLATRAAPPVRKRAPPWASGGGCELAHSDSFGLVFT